MPDEIHERRLGVAQEYNLRLYASYSEKQAAAIVGYDYSTMKRKRRLGQFPFVDRGGGSVAYMGYQIADIISEGVRAVGQPPPEQRQA